MTSGRKLLSRLGWGFWSQEGVPAGAARFLSFGCGLPPNPVRHPWKHVRGSGFYVRFSETYLASRPQTGQRDREGGRWAAIRGGHMRASRVRMRVQVSSRGAHGLSCSLGFGRQARYSNVNDIIHRSLNKAGIQAIKEPSGLTRSDGKRPDGQTLIPWNDGRTLLWEATVVDTVAASYITETAAAAGWAAEIAATRKHAKYSELER